MYLGEDILEKKILHEIKTLKEENKYLRKCIRAGSDSVRCAVCGKEIPHLSIQRMTRPILWCSRACFKKKPRKIVKLEQQYEMDIVEILKETTRRCGNIRTQCEVLGISIPYLYAIIKDHCNKDLISFMEEYSTGKRKELYVKKLNKQLKNKDIEKTECEKIKEIGDIALKKLNKQLKNKDIEKTECEKIKEIGDIALKKLNKI